MTLPRVAVLMAVYNEESFLAEAIDSVLAQTFGDFELVIVDDGSTDRSREIAASYRDPRIRLIVNETNQGLPRALNRGLSAIRSEYVARLDGNDVSFPERLAKQVAHLDAHPNVAVLGTQVLSIDVRGRRIRRVKWWNAQWQRPVGQPAMEWYRIFDTPFVHSSVMFRRAEVEAVGGYDERHPINQDAVLWRELALRHAIDNLGEELVGFRFDPRSMTADPTRRERIGYDALRIEIVHKLLREGLRWDDAPRRYAELWTRAHGPDEVRELVAAIEDCTARFDAIHPDARNDRDVARHRASLFARAAEEVAAYDRRLALSYARRMAALHPASAVRFLPRLALVAFGRRMLEAWRASRQRRALRRRSA